MTDLVQRSIDIILSNQAASGAYVASPNFPTYQYCWFRDGSFIAYAMDLSGQAASAARFHAWAAGAINARADLVRRAVQKARRGEPLTGVDVLHTRYTLDGQEATGEVWPNFQLDGFGTWLWAVGEHARLHGPLPPECLQAAGLVADYLAALWAQPCYDCWEEFPDKVHPHTLAAIYGGLQAYSRLVATDLAPTLKSIRQYIFDHLQVDGHFVKYAGTIVVDASLLGLATPYRVVEPGDPIMRATLEQIEVVLQRGGGLHRYAADTYYGGGEWLLLTAWLAWHYAELGEAAKAQAALAWVEAQAGDKGQMPEQVPMNLNDPGYLEPWQARWGASASPLLWSHAQYVIAARLRDVSVTP